MICMICFNDVMIVCMILIFSETWLRVKAIVNFVGETVEVSFIDPGTLSKVILINVVMKMVFCRNSYRAKRFIVEVTLQENRQ